MTESDLKQQDTFEQTSSMENTTMTSAEGGNADTDAAAELDKQSQSQAQPTSAECSRPEAPSESEPVPPTSRGMVIFGPSFPDLPAPPRPASLFSLPADVVCSIAGHLEYPDVVSLQQSDDGLAEALATHSNSSDRSSWIESRVHLGLPVPTGQPDFKTDAAFLSNRKLRGFVAARADHGECLSQDDRSVARSLARMRHGNRKGTNLCFITGGPCVAVLERRHRLHVLNRRRQRGAGPTVVDKVWWGVRLCVAVPLCLVLLWVAYQIHMLLF
ncbi:hypothetical protein PV08_09858 [Exophiala spinifera]|uniref:F-box domain-containing protein n=1 Tax=Exophiala spinifera TaxID=91928 RepID=A0A0D2B1V4_9EURO|nr:uncharacterized protein PV08_09858 [Exophiala spinifera]KIW12580.1 hypothetical protein PV08_09858 [Exophiala spinifera]